MSNNKPLLGNKIRELGLRESVCVKTGVKEERRFPINFKSTDHLFSFTS
jgi:hypothetical protein